MNQTQAIHQCLKRHLRSQGRTYAEVAKVLDLSEPSVKRLFSECALSVSRLEAICNFLKLDVGELVNDSQQEPKLVTELEPEQEKTLLEDPALLLVTFLVLNRCSVEEILSQWQFTRPELTKKLIQLERWNIIQLLPYDRIRVLAARHFTWRRAGLVQTQLGRDVLLEFLDSHFDAAGEKMRFASGMLSQASIERVHVLMDEFLREFDHLVENDQDLPIGQRQGVAMYTGFRPWEFSAFQKFRKSANAKGG